MRNKSVTYVVQAAVIAALYVVLTLLANALGLSSYSIQVRTNLHVRFHRLSQTWLLFRGFCVMDTDLRRFTMVLTGRFLLTWLR